MTELNNEQERREIAQFNEWVEREEGSAGTAEKAAMFTGWLAAKRAAQGSAEPVGYLAIRDIDGLKDPRIASSGVVLTKYASPGRVAVYTAPPAPVSAEPVLCHQCGLPQSDNPHPDAGKPATLLEVNVQSVCIPCLTLSRHQWARRAQIAESALSDDKLRQVGAETMRACETLPFGYQIIIELEEGYGGVKLIDPEGKSQDVEGSDTFGGNIRDAIDIGLAAAIAAKEAK